MPLPNPGQDAVPFTTLTAEFYDDTIENIESLADGTGLDNGAVVAAKRSGGFYGILYVFPTGTGSKSITGLPFAPKSVEVIGDIDDITAGTSLSFSTGHATQNDGGGIYQFGKSLAISGGGGTQSSIHSTTSFIYRVASAGTVLVDIRVTSFNSDGITVNVVAEGSTTNRRTWSLIFRG